MSESNNKYNVEVIIKKCDSIEDKTQLINYLSEILQEKKKDILYRLYALMKKDFIIKTLEKTLNIMNSGGIKKIDDDKNMRSVGGTFMYLIKTSDVINEDLLKKIFWRNNKKKKMKKKLYKSFNKLDIKEEKSEN
jgi:hypothetical protein